MHTVIVYEIFKKEKGLRYSLKSLLKGTLFLAGVLLVSKLFGFVYRIAFTRLAGENVVGIYMTVYPTFIFFIAVMQLGLPLAVTKLSAHFHAIGQPQAVQAVLKRAFTLSKVSIIFWLPIMLIVSPLIATTLLHNKDAQLTLLVAIVTVPVVVFSSIYRGYLQGIDRLSASAWSTLFEQCVRLLLLLTFLPLAIGQAPVIVAACAMGITAGAEVAALFFSYICYTQSKSKLLNPTLVSYNELLHIALPTAGSKLFGSFTWFLEPIIFLYALTKSGLTSSYATTAYGLVSNVHIPLLLFPAFIPQALAIALVPSISALQAKGAYKKLNAQLHETLRMCSCIACYAAGGFFIGGDLLASRLFDVEHLNWLKVLAPVFFFYYIQSPLNSVLQALGYAQVAMKNSILGGCIKLVCLFALASLPSLQITGAIISIGIGVMFTTFMHVASVQSVKNVSLAWGSLLSPYFVFLISIGAAYFVEPVSLQLSVVFCSLTVGLVVFKQIRFSDFLLIKQLLQRFTLNK